MSAALSALAAQWDTKATELRVRKVAMQDAIDSMCSTLRPHELEQMAMVYDYCAQDLREAIRATTTHPATGQETE